MEALWYYNTYVDKLLLSAAEGQRPRNYSSCCSCFYLNSLIQRNGVVTRQILGIVTLNDLAVLSHEAPTQNKFCLN